MIGLLLTLALPQDAMVEPRTRADLDALSTNFAAARFDVAIDANNRLSCSATPKMASATLSIQSCIAAAKCAESGERDAAKLARCVDRAKPGLWKAYRRDWLKAHAE